MSQQPNNEALQMVLSFINGTIDDIIEQLQPLTELTSDLAARLAVDFGDRSIKSSAHLATVTLHEIEKETDARRKNELIEEYGPTKYWSKMGAKAIHQDRFGTIYRHESDGEYRFFVRVVNSTREPDGSRKEYFIRVPPYMVSARQAVAWTFGMEARDYSPAVES